MSGTSAYTANAVLGHVFGATTMPKPSLYFALFRGDPDTGGGEVGGNSYSRVPPSAGFTVSGRTATNAANTDFPTASGPWGHVTHVAICDAPEGGNRLFSVPLTAAKDPDDGNVVRLPAGFPSVTLPLQSE